MSTETLQHAMNRLAGTTDLDAQGAANIWAGTTGLDLVGALNTKAEILPPSWLELEGVLNFLAGTIGLGSDAAAAAIFGGVYELLTELGDSLRTELSDSLTLEH